MSPDVAARAFFLWAQRWGSLMTTTQPDSLPLENLRGFVEGLTSVLHGLAHWLQSPAGRKFVGFVSEFAAAAPKVEALHLVLIEGSTKEGDLNRAGSVLGLRRRAAAAAVLLAAGDIHTRQRVRLGRAWVKDASNRVVAIVPSEDLSIAEMFRWLRARAFRQLPATRRRRTRLGGEIPRSRELPLELTQLATETPRELELTARDAQRLLAFLEPVASPRQLQLVELRLKGHTTAGAARCLGIKERTAYVHLHRLRGKRLRREARELLLTAL